MAKPRTPTAVEELLEPTSLEDKARQHAKWYRALALDKENLEVMRLGNLSEPTDVAPSPVPPGYYPDPKGEAEHAGAKARSYRQQSKRIEKGMEQIHEAATKAEIWKLVEEKLDELKRNPQAF